jgi:tRNA A37 threonylcarbamoyladenosine biosynthesis protein TsaE
MLERDAELAALAHAAREAADRHGSVVLVKGEAGIGKSSLVEALRSHLPPKAGCWSATAMIWPHHGPSARSVIWSAASEPSSATP